MTNKKAANPYTNGEGGGQALTGGCTKWRLKALPTKPVHDCVIPGHPRPSLPGCCRAAANTLGSHESGCSLPSAGVQPPWAPRPCGRLGTELWLLGAQLGGQRCTERPRPDQLSLPAGWKLNPVVGAVYGPEFYAGNV